MPLTTLDDNSRLLEWSRTWNAIVQSDAFGGSVQATTEKGATMRYVFGSGSVAIYGTITPCTGTVGVDVYVDNQIQVAQRFPCGSSSVSTVLFFESIPLPPFTDGTKHVIQITNAGSAPLFQDNLDVADFVAGRTPSFASANPPPTPSPLRSPLTFSTSPNPTTMQKNETDSPSQGQNGR